MPEQIVLQQALFGYRDGHNLLSTSATLTPRVRQFLATVTDSSGPESSKGFENAFTGLQVPDTDFYALFCTWAAPEMPRPGCVWSHVVLIQLADLARIPDLYQLRHFCLRPSLPLLETQYVQPLTFQLGAVKEGRSETTDRRRRHLLLRALYECTEQSIVVLDERGEDWENAIFEVWTQQWPRLRREFSFSTGSLGDRRLAGILFDLQIAPISSERLWRRVGEPTLVLKFGSTTFESLDRTVPQWIPIAEADLSVESTRRFRRFLFTYGSDVESPRTAFRKLAVIYQSISNSPEYSWNNLLLLVSKCFPNRREAVRLKRWLLTVPTTLDPSEKLERVWSIASFLLDSNERDAFPRHDLDFANMATSLWKAKQEDTIALLSRLVQREESSAVVSFAKEIARSVDSHSFRMISESHDELVPLVIYHNQTLAYEIDTWKLKAHVQTQVHETLLKLALREEEWSRIVGAMMIAATFVSVREAVTLAGRHAILGALRWLESPAANQGVPSQVWKDALATPAEEYLQKTQSLIPAQLALISWCISANQLRQSLSAEREDVQRLADALLIEVPSPLRIPTAFLLMTIGLRENTHAAARLVLKTFFVVHEALASGKHSPESWWLLSPELPDMGWWRDWDRCEKLRRATHRVLKPHRCIERLRELATTSEEKKIARKVAKYEEFDDT